MKNSALAIAVFIALGTSVYAGTLVDQGAPGRQGPWPVYIQTLPDGGGGAGGSSLWMDGGSQPGSITPVTPANVDTPKWMYVDGGQPVATQAQLAATSGWQQLLNCDFSAQTSATWSDGTHTACGATWTCENNANAATTTQIIHGTGLQFKPSTTATTYVASTWTAPDCKVAIASLFALEPDEPIRFCIQQSNNGANVGQDGFFGISTVAQAGNNYSVQFGFGSSIAQAIAASTTTRGAGGSASFNQLVSVATNDTECITAIGGIFNRTTQSYGFLDAGNFDPSLQTVFNTAIFDTSSSQVWQGGSTTFPVNTSTFQAFLGAMGASASTATYTFKHIWIYKQ